MGLWEQGWCSGRVLASHRCRPDSIPGPGVICGLSLVLVLVLAPKVFHRVLRFSSLHKNQHSKFQFDLETEAKEPPRGCATAKFQFNSIQFGSITTTVYKPADFSENGKVILQS